MPNQQPALDPVFRALADPTRRRIVERLIAGEASVGELARPIEMALPSLLQHLRVLEESGLVTSRKVGRVRVCRLAPEPLARAERWMAEQRRLWEEHTDRLEGYLRRIQAMESES